MIFWRDWSWKTICFVDKCPHRWIALSTWKVLDNYHLQCPFHWLEFDNTWKCTVIPANGKNSKVTSNFDAKKYKTYEKYWFISIFWGDENKIKNEPVFFNNLDWLEYRTVQDPWNMHYSRVIENQLDCAHVPFIHKNTIGKWNRTLVDW